MIGENLELIEEVTANSDNISEGELVYVSDGSEVGTRVRPRIASKNFKAYSPTSGGGTAVSENSSLTHSAIPK